jgi:hypothetical protein
MCARVIDFTCFYDFSVGFWNCQNSVVFVSFYFISDAGLQLALDSWEVTFRQQTLKSGRIVYIYRRLMNSFTTIKCICLRMTIVKGYRFYVFLRFF